MTRYGTVLSRRVTGRRGGVAERARSNDRLCVRVCVCVCVCVCVRVSIEDKQGDANDANLIVNSGKTVDLCCVCCCLLVFTGTGVGCVVV